MTKPIRPLEIQLDKQEPWRVAVFETFNQLIARHYDGVRAYVKQGSVVAMLVARGYSADEIRDGRWLDIEMDYEEAGWSVIYTLVPEPDECLFQFKRKEWV